jgi:alpha/beta superfamily hydrolase
VNPFYFGSSEKSLFGIYHPPSNEKARRCGIVICQPIGHEYIHGYRALRQLAYQLARAGFPVLRFDYHGCGDSAGDTLEGSLTQWINDIEAAIEEIKSRGPLSKICLIGARVGATLSVLVGSQRADLEAVVLWDPVVNGRHYLDNLIAQHQKWLDQRSTRMQSPEPNKEIFEALGFPVNAAVEEGLEQLDLLSVKIRPARHALTLETDKTHHGMQLSDHLRGIGVDSEYQHISAPRVWLRRRRGDNVVVPVQMLQAIVGWVSRITI